MNSKIFHFHPEYSRRIFWQTGIPLPHSVIDGIWPMPPNHFGENFFENLQVNEQILGRENCLALLFCTCDHNVKKPEGPLLRRGLPLRERCNFLFLGPLLGTLVSKAVGRPEMAIFRGKFAWGLTQPGTEKGLDSTCAMGCTILHRAPSPQEEEAWSV